MRLSTAALSEPVLDRRLGPLDAAAVIVSNVIGGGILFTPPQVAASVPSALLFLSTWAAGGVLAFAGAIAYAELAALRPHAGGEYVYLREAYGRLAAFLTGWTSFVAGFSGAIAANAVFFAVYMGRFVPAAGVATPFLVLPIVPGILELTFSPQTVCALVLVWGFAFIHLRGVGTGRLVGNILAVLKVSALVLFVAFGFSFGAGNPSNVVQTGPVAPASWLLALIPVMFAYSGWNAASYIAEEIRDPGRNVPRAFALGTGAVVALYLALNMLYLYVLPIDRLATIKGSVLDVVADGLLGPAAGDVMAAVAIISLSASVSAMTFAGPRVYFAMARDGLFFRRAAAVHPKYRTPATAIVAQAIWASLLLVSAKGDTLVNYTGFAITLFLGVAVAAVFVLRSREPNADRPFRAWGYPLFPGLFVVASAAILINALWNGPAAAVASAVVMALGLPFYLWFRRQ
ncbi:MAG TPA: amino acid permease [Vicinamibacterales bacterium]|nr:amino acid permease [Vicinamibacterales bacterium]